MQGNDSVCTGEVWLLRKTGQDPEGNFIFDWLALALKADGERLQTFLLKPLYLI